MRKNAKFDAVYPYDGDNNFELTHSIRLLKKHAKGLRNVYVIGNNPDIEGVIHVPYIQEDAKEINIWKKTCAACFISEISDDFLFINDDHFIISDIDFLLPDYYEGQLSDIQATGQYREAVENTITEMQYCDFSQKNFDIHCPIFFNKQKFLEMFDYFGIESELLMKSCYCNYHQIEGVQMEDLKFRWMANKQDIEMRVKGRWVFSTHELLMTQDLSNYIKGI